MKSRKSCPSVLFIRHILHPTVAGSELEGAARARSWQSTRIKSTDSLARSSASKPGLPAPRVTLSKFLHLSDPWLPPLGSEGDAGTSWL